MQIKTDNILNYGKPYNSKCRNGHVVIPEEFPLYTQKLHMLGLLQSHKI